MPVPSSLSDLSVTPSANSPQGTESAKGTIDDYFRAAFAFIAQLNAEVAGATVTLASSGTVNIGAANSLNVAITGTTTITAFDTIDEGTLRWVTFGSSLTLTYNAVSMILPGSANITTAAGDSALFKSLGGGKWKCLAYQLSGAQIAAILAGRTIGGDLGVSGQMLLKDGTSGSPGLSFSTDKDTGFTRSADGTISVVCNGAVVGTFAPSGFSAIKITQTAP